MAATFSIDADFDCSLERLWSFVSHVPNQDQWVFGMSDSEVVGGGEIGVGSRVVGTSTERGTSLRVTMEVVDYDPPNRVSWENTDGHTPFVTVITCSGRRRQVTHEVPGHAVSDIDLDESLHGSLAAAGQHRRQQDAAR